MEVCVYCHQEIGIYNPKRIFGERYGNHIECCSKCINDVSNQVNQNNFLNNQNSVGLNREVKEYCAELLNNACIRYLEKKDITYLEFIMKYDNYNYIDIAFSLESILSEEKILGILPSEILSLTKFFLD